MSSIVDKTTIYSYQGDDAFVYFKLEQLGEGDLIYFDIRDRKTNKSVLEEELKSRVDENHFVKFEITHEMLDKIPVKLSENATKYYYGIKRVDEETGQEDTILLKENENADVKFGENYLFILYRKKAEGE